MYSALSIFAVIRTLKMYSKLSITKYARTFYVIALLECLIRALTFISIVIDLENIQYEALFILVSVPDSIFVLIYLILLIILIDIYYYSHIISSLNASLLQKTTTNRNKFVNTGLSIIFALILFQIVTYSAYTSGIINSDTISLQNAYINIIIPSLGAIYIVYLQVIFSGIPIKSQI